MFSGFLLAGLAGDRRARQFLPINALELCLPMSVLRQTSPAIFCQVSAVAGKIPEEVPGSPPEALLPALQIDGSAEYQMSD